MATTEELMEELTVQQVMLESMRDDDWDGIEDERRIVSRKIVDLKALLAQASNRPTTSSGSSKSPARSMTGILPLRSQPGISAMSKSPLTRIDTPQGKYSVEEGLLSWPNHDKKRKLGAEDSESITSQSKSRRSTPITSGLSTPLSTRRETPFGRDGSLDVIDLTADDVDFDASIVAQQIREQDRRKQEDRDRKLASYLEKQSSTLRQDPALDSQRRDAFAHIMGSQRSGSRGTAEWDQPSINKEYDQPSVFPAFQPQNMMPGGYDPQWEVPFGFSPSSPFRPSSQLDARFFQPNGSRPMAASSSKNSYPYQENPQFGRVPSLPSSSRGDYLSHVINTTSMFDYNNGVDQLGNPFNSRLTNILDDNREVDTGKELKDLLKNIQPDVVIPGDNQEKGPDDLRYPLYRHQGVALTWMKRMEEGTNKGGILADDMGLGKTISTLSLILANPAPSFPKTNLIIGPLSLINQWREEIKSKLKPNAQLDVLVHHGKRHSTDELMRHQVVLTTYGTIASELKHYELYHVEMADRKMDSNDSTWMRKFPLLHPKARFHRVILDEAQFIKNRNTLTAKACCLVNATYRWCLTGTPMMNGVLELFSLLKFLQIKPYNSWNSFRQTFGMLFGMKGDSKSMAMDKLRALLKAIMLRRKKDSLLDGKRILELPPKTEQVIYATFSTDERDFYQQLEEKAQVLFNKYLREGTVGKNYSSILVLLLRLRQACCHPHLNLDAADAANSSNAESGEDNEELASLVRNLEGSIVKRIKDAGNEFECPICFDVVQSPFFFIPCGHDSCRDCLIRLADGAKAQNVIDGNESDKAKCPVCRVFFNPRKCFSYDLFKNTHMPESSAKLEPLTDESSGDEDEEIDEDEVDSKGNLKGFIVDDSAKNEDDGDGELAEIETLKRSSSKLAPKRPSEEGQRIKTNKGKKKQPSVRATTLKSLRKEAIKSMAAHKKYMQYLRQTWMPAAKVTECMNLLRDIAKTGDKIIIFSQWTLLLDLLQVAMWKEGMVPEPLRYDGSMSGDQRSAMAHQFREDPSKKVMLVSLRAGNAGLNLTAANRVIIMDPFWNPYIEMQAIDRTYRIGQQREVQVYRILTQETIEDRIVELQNKKKEIVEAALDENESVKIGRLTNDELAFLFNARG